MKNKFTQLHRVTLTSALNILFLLSVATFTSCKTSNPDFDSLTQIEGTWVMQFDGSAVYEKWEKVNDTLYKGTSFEISRGDTVPTETLQIISNENGVFYIPTVADQNEGKPVRFKLAVHEGNRYEFDNPDHDFPTNITYEFFPGDKLKATISGMVNNEMRSLEFDYVRVK